VTFDFLLYRNTLSVVADSAYSDLHILSGRSTGLRANVFSSISEQVNEVKEARSHLFKPSENDKNAVQNATADVPAAEVHESPTQQADNEDKSENVQVVKPELSELRHRHSPHQTPSPADKRYKTHKDRVKPEINRTHNEPHAEKQEIKQMPKDKLHTSAAAQKQPSDDVHAPRSKKSESKHRSHAAGRDEQSEKSDTSKREKQKKSETTAEAQQPVVADKHTAENSESRLKKSSGSRQEPKEQSHSNKESRVSEAKTASHKVKSVAVQPVEKARSEFPRKISSSSEGNGRHRSAEAKSAEEITSMVLHSFDEVSQVSVINIVDVLVYWFVANSQCYK